MQSENNEHEQESLAQQAEQFAPMLSDAWRELLGFSNEANETADSTGVQPLYSKTDLYNRPAAGSEVGAELPALTNDPWTALQHVQGIEIIDLRQVHSQAHNDLNLEQVLQFMQEQSTPGGQEK